MIINGLGGGYQWIGRALGGYQFRVSTGFNGLGLGALFSGSSVFGELYQFGCVQRSFSAVRSTVCLLQHSSCP